MDSVARVSWQKIKTDPATRLELLKKARESGGTGEVLAALYDAVRAIAATKPEAQDAEKEKFGDLLAALGIGFEAEREKEGATAGNASAVVPECKGAPQAQGAAVASAESGFGAVRPTPQFAPGPAVPLSPPSPPSPHA